MIMVIPFLENIYMKNKGVFGDTLLLINYYIHYGKDFVSQNVKYMELVINWLDNQIGYIVSI